MVEKQLFIDPSPLGPKELSEDEMLALTGGCAFIMAVCFIACALIDP
jgi:hypothetical protein